MAPMKITKILVGAVRSNGNFGNDRVAVEAEVEPGESATRAFEEARTFVLDRLPGGKVTQARALAIKASALAQESLVARAQAAAMFTGDDVPF
jgi:hypothetical protein